MSIYNSLKRPSLARPTPRNLPQPMPSEPSPTARYFARYLIGKEAKEFLDPAVSSVRWFELFRKAQGVQKELSGATGALDDVKPRYYPL